MNRFIKLLSLVLVAQLLLVAVVFWPQQDPGAIDANTALLDLETQAIDRIIVSDSESSVLLSRQDERWVMPELHGLPAQAARVDRLLSELPALPRGWHIAASEEAAQRFEVSEDRFQSRVEYFSGDSSVGAIYIGTSPGFRKVHSRLADGDEIYAVEYNNFELPARPEEWLDKSLLRISQPTAIDGPDFSLRLEQERWRDPQGAEADIAVADGLASGLVGLRVIAAVDIATAAVLDAVDAPPTLTVTTSAGKFEYRLYEMKEQYYVQRADIPVYFSLSAYDYDRLNDVNAESLYPPVKEEPAEDTEDEGKPS